MATIQQKQALVRHKWGTLPVYPGLVTAANRVIQHMNAAGYVVQVESAGRTLAEQRRLYSYGRTVFYDEGEAKGIVTNLKVGVHNLLLACDFIFIQDGKRTYSPYAVKGSTRPPWQELGVAIRSAGAYWGGDWKGFVDLPHMQLIPVVAQGEAFSELLNGVPYASIWNHLRNRGYLK